MRPVECRHEQDVMDAIASARWPHRCDAELRAHVEACDMCSDLVEVVVPLKDDFERALLEARVPTAGAVWWRAQVRARLEAESLAARPMRLFTAVALAAATGLVAAVLSVGWPWIRTWLWAQGIEAPSLPDASGFVASVARGGPILVATALVVVAAPLALVFALADRHGVKR